MKFQVRTYLLCLLGLMSAQFGRGQSSSDRMQHMDAAKQGAMLKDHSLLIDTRGDSTYFSDLKGDWLLIDYWSTSCLPCIAEMPHVQALAKKYSGKGLKVIMVNLDKKEKKWKRGISAFSPPEPNYRTDRSITNQFFAINLVEVVDDNGKSALSTLMPQYVLIDPEGKIIDKKMPKPSKTEFGEKLHEYMNSTNQKLKKP